jgi:type II secretory pathway component PulM
MLFDQGTPDTSVYMIAGYVIFFAVTLIYLASFFIRERNLRRDLETLQTMEAEVEEPAPEVASYSAAKKAKPASPKKKAARSARKKAAQKR